SFLKGPHGSIARLKEKPPQRLMPGRSRVLFLTHVAITTRVDQADESQGLAQLLEPACSRPGDKSAERVAQDVARPIRLLDNLPNRSLDKDLEPRLLFQEVECRRIPDDLKAHVLAHSGPQLCLQERIPLSRRHVEDHRLVRSAVELAIAWGQ